MLAQTVKDNLKDINNLRMRTKATKFGSLFQTVPVEKGGVSNLRQVLMREGLVEISEEEFVEDIIIKDEPVAEEETSDVADTEDETGNFTIN